MSLSGATVVISTLRFRWSCCGSVVTGAWEPLPATSATAKPQLPRRPATDLARCRERSRLICSGPSRQLCPVTARGVFGVIRHFLSPAIRGSASASVRTALLNRKCTEGSWQLAMASFPGSGRSVITKVEQETSCVTRMAYLYSSCRISRAPDRIGVSKVRIMIVRRIFFIFLAMEKCLVASCSEKFSLYLFLSGGRTFSEFFLQIFFIP